MWNSRWQQQHFAFLNPDVPAPTRVDDLQHHVTFDLEKKFRSFVNVKVAARVWATDDHDDEVVLFEYLLVAHRRAQLGAVLVDPAQQVERGQ
jgi:hypothetical protein